MTSRILLIISSIVKDDFGVGILGKLKSIMRRNYRLPTIVASRTEDSFSVFIFLSVRAVFHSLVTLDIRFVESENVGQVFFELIN